MLFLEFLKKFTTSDNVEEFRYYNNIDNTIVVKTNQAAIGAYSQYENEGQIAFQFDKPSQAIFANVDRNLWTQVMVNLLQNAQQALSGIDQGKIRVTISVVDHQCLVEVIDNGCGISSEEADRIFTPHFTTKSSGSGIGLSLVKQIVEKHGGTISFESKENEGTTFRLALPSVD